MLENLESSPKSSDLYLWCDYVELLCVANIDRRFSKDNLIEIINDGRDVSTDQPLNNIDPLLDPYLEDDEIDIDNEEEELPAEEDDNVERKVSDIFNGIAFRQMIFGNAYPFYLDTEKRELFLNESFTVRNQLYVQLLLSSGLRYVPKKRRHELTGPFEILSYQIFKCLMPRGWNVHTFGAKNSTRYSGHLFDRLTKLAEDIRGSLMLKKTDFKTRNAGDGGLDLIAWHPLGDSSRPGIPIAFAQCGCTAEEWGLKMLEASPAKLAPHIHLLHLWSTYYFMPLDLIKSEGSKQDWQRKPQISSAITIDRFRILQLAKEYRITRKCVTALKPIEEVLERD